MINRILNAYEETRRQREDSFFKIMKCAGIETKVYLIIYIMCNFAMIITMVLGQIKLFVCALIIMMMASQIWDVMNRKRNQKKWNVNIHKYQDRLDMIREILSKPEFNMYEKNKLKQLIRKYKKDIDNHETKDLRLKGDYSNFLSRYIIPVVAFGAGKLSQEMTGVDLVVICVYMLIFLIYVKMIGDGIRMIRTEIVEGNEIERKHLFMQELQDLLDRDFPIEEKDLLYI